MESKLRSPKRFEKTHSRMVHPCDQRGLGDASPTSRILDYGPRMPCLPFSSERFDEPFLERSNKEASNARMANNSHPRAYWGSIPKPL